MKLSNKYSPVLFAFFMSLLMGLMVSGALSLLHTGLNGIFFKAWFTAFLTAWPIVFGGIILIAPLVQKMVAAIVSEP